MAEPMEQYMRMDVPFHSLEDMPPNSLLIAIRNGEDIPRTVAFTFTDKASAGVALRTSEDVCRDFINRNL